ncbi:MAG: integral rane sensor signal transduction histidine kinase [Candidatus Solibacter sp.]|jgi:two-component system sensor histidine kinase KdpD|nr:integral rane sensor signal transduction histidine kinase [Candidatus Solibacter sp.]
MRLKLTRFPASLLAVAATISLYRWVLEVNATTVALSLLLVILAVSARWGLAEATVASVVAVLALNYYFLPPVGEFTIQDPQNWAALGAFLVTAVTASQLSARARRRAAEAEVRRLEIERLYALLQAMILSGNVRRTLHEFVQTVVKVFGCEAAVFYYRPGEEVFRSGSESEPVTDHDLLVAAELDDISIDPARRLATASVRLGGRPLGSMALLGELPSPQTLRAIVNLIAITVEKARALEDASHAEAARQSEVLKSALLDSLAHDIKTPLTSIKAAVTSLLSTAPGGDHELLTIINEEADRLNQLAAEVIAMARVEAGKLHLDKRPVEAAALIQSALAGLAVKRIAVQIAEGLPPAVCDPELVQQVIKQLIENALKYSPEGIPVTISAARKDAKIVIGVADRGPGIDEDERARIFDKFFRGRRHRFEIKGTGMGLAIAKGIIEAHGEKIWVESEPDHGSAFYFSLPAAEGGAV